MADVSAGGVHNRILGDNALTRDAALLKDTVREAGALALSLFRTELKNWTKGASSPVSEADIRVNDLLESRLRSATPDYGWLSEESADDETRLGKPLVWIVDPIDGTRGYLAGREDWCVSAALVEGGSPLLAAVLAPASDEFFFAARGHRADPGGPPAPRSGDPRRYVRRGDCQADADGVPVAGRPGGAGRRGGPAAGARRDGMAGVDPGRPRERRSLGARNAPQPLAHVAGAKDRAFLVLLMGGRQAEDVSREC